MLHPNKFETQISCQSWRIVDLRLPFINKPYSSIMTKGSSEVCLSNIALASFQWGLVRSHILRQKMLCFVAGSTLALNKLSRAKQRCLNGWIWCNSPDLSNLNLRCLSGFTSPKFLLDSFRVVSSQYNSLKKYPLTLAFLRSLLPLKGLMLIREFS